jgi:hypothetical protein
MKINELFIAKRNVLVMLLAGLFLTSCSGGSSSEAVNALPKSVAAADETNAIQTLRTISSAEAQVKVTRGSYADFPALNQAGFLDERFASNAPVLRGYQFTIKSSDDEFSVNADPQATGAAPNARSRHLYLDSSDNTIHVNPVGAATKSDPPL